MYFNKRDKIVDRDLGLSHHIISLRPSVYHKSQLKFIAAAVNSDLTLSAKTY